MLQPRQKIKVFISSICGEPKYDKIRAKMKELIESSKLAEVYLFEATEASTLTAEQHYLLDLETSDVCIFLIDNADGVRAGVQREIDLAKKHKIKSLYYFCDEQSKEMTAVQKGLLGAQYAKSKVVHSFEELTSHGAQGLIDDITLVYKYYCKGYIEVDSSYTDNLDIEQETQDTSLIVKKTIISQTDKCKEYFYNMFSHSYKKEKQTCEFDSWCLQFLPILFENASIKSFNVSMFMDELKKHQPDELFTVVNIRWKAIQHYYNGRLKECVEELKNALAIAKQKNLSEWFVKDILIDLRNKNYELLETENKFALEDPSQKELNESSHGIYYPLMDRMKGDFYEKYVEEAFKEKIQSPHTVSLGYNITQTDIISNCFVVAMFNGSLTYLQLLHKQIKTLAFWMSEKFSDWKFQKLLLKETIFECPYKEIASLYRTAPDILVKLNHEDALEVFEYCNNHPIGQKRFKSKLHAWSIVGYYLNDEYFDLISAEIINDILTWLNEENPTLSIGDSIFKCLMDVGHRLMPETIIEICCLLMDKEFSRFYSDMFKLITSKIDISKVPIEKATSLIEHVSLLLEGDNINLPCLDNLLISLRKQSVFLTQDLDEKICKRLPDFYNGNYKLETTENHEDDVLFVEKYIKQIKNRNEEQGKGGVYHGYANFPHDIIRNIMLFKNALFSDNIKDDAFVASCETLLRDNQNIRTKCDALDLIMFLLRKDVNISKRNSIFVEKIKNSFNMVSSCSDVLFDGNISRVSLNFSYNLFLTFFDNSSYVKLLEVLPYIQDNIADQIQICNTIYRYLENDESLIIDEKLEAIFLQIILTWFNSKNVDVRWHCTKILFSLARNDQLNNIISCQLIFLIDNDNVYIKNLIQNLIVKSNIDENTKQYIALKCEMDANYVVRKVYKETLPAKQ